MLTYLWSLDSGYIFLLWIPAWLGSASWLMKLTGFWKQTLRRKWSRSSRSFQRYIEFVCLSPLPSSDPGAYEIIMVPWNCFASSLCGLDCVSGKLLTKWTSTNINLQVSPFSYHRGKLKLWILRKSLFNLNFGSWLQLAWYYKKYCFICLNI